MASQRVTRCSVRYRSTLCDILGLLAPLGHMAANLVHHGAFTLKIVMPRTLKQPQGARRTHIRRAHTHFASYARNLYHLGTNVGRKFVFAHYFHTEG